MAETDEVLKESSMEPEMSTEELRQQVVATQEDIAETVEEVGERIQQKLDWREYVGKAPFVALGIAAGIGFIGSALLPKRPTAAERITGAVGEAVGNQLSGFLGGMRRTAIKSSLGSLALMMAVGLAKRAATQAILSEGSSSSARTRESTSSPEANVA